jgi:hypothetical protein
VARIRCGRRGAGDGLLFGLRWHRNPSGESLILTRSASCLRAAARDVHRSSGVSQRNEHGKDRDESG